MITWMMVALILVILIVVCQECSAFKVRSLGNIAVSTCSKLKRAKTFPLFKAVADDLGGWNDNHEVSGVTLKIAIDSQGGVSDLSSKKSDRFTCGASLDMVHRLRRCSDAVLVGRATVVNDDCSLTVRRVPLEVESHGEKGERKTQHRQQPIRVVIDPHKSLELSRYTIAHDGFPTILVHMNPTCVRYTSDEFPNVEYLGIPPRSESESGRTSSLSSQEISDKLRSLFGVRHLMVEGGPTTANSFLREGMVDRAIIVRAPISFHEPLLWEPWSSSLASSPLEAAGLVLLGTELSGVDTIEYWSRPDNGWPSDPDSLSSWP